MVGWTGDNTPAAMSPNSSPITVPKICGAVRISMPMLKPTIWTWCSLQFLTSVEPYGLPLETRASDLRPILGRCNITKIEWAMIAYPEVSESTPVYHAS